MDENGFSKTVVGFFEKHLHTIAINARGICLNSRGEKNRRKGNSVVGIARLYESFILGRIPR